MGCSQRSQHMMLHPFSLVKTLFCTRTWIRICKKTMHSAEGCQIRRDQQVLACVQVKQEQPVAPLQAAASAPDQAAAPPAKFALPANLDLSALGKLAAALGVGTVKMPSSAPAQAQPVLSQGWLEPPAGRRLCLGSLSLA